MRSLHKYIRETSSRYAAKFQSQMFNMYIRKFVRKFIKLLTHNEDEHPELSEYVKVNHTLIQELCIYVRMHRDDIIRLLVYYYCMNKPIQSSYQVYYHEAYSGVRHIVDDKIQKMIRQNFYTSLPENYLSNPFIDLFIRCICSIASDLRKGFFHSDIIAKTKTTEHWIERMPVYMLCSIIILVMKVFIDTYVIYTTVFSYLYVADIFVSMSICGTATYLVFLRVPQSICAEAKRAASDTYIFHKTNLHIYFLEQTGKLNKKNYFDGIVSNSFENHITTLEEDYVGVNSRDISNKNAPDNNMNV